MHATTLAVVGLVVLGVTLALLLVLVRATRELRGTADRISAARDRLEPVADGVRTDAEAARRRLEQLRADGAPDAR